MGGINAGTGVDAGVGADACIGSNNEDAKSFNSFLFSDTNDLVTLGEIGISMPC